MDVYLSGRYPSHSAVAIVGDLDLASTSKLRVSLHQALLTCRRAICLDLSGVTFLDSAGLRALLAVAQSASDLDRTVCVAAKSPAVIRILELVQLAPGSTYLARPAHAEAADHIGRIPRRSSTCTVRHRIRP